MHPRTSTTQLSRRKTAAFSSLTPCKRGLLPLAWLGEVRGVFIRVGHAPMVNFFALTGYSNGVKHHE